MQGVVGLILVVVGLVLIYDVVAGKAASIANLFNGQIETTTKVTGSNTSTSNTGIQQL